MVEQLGGEIQAVEVSALKRINLVSLLEAIVAQAEVMQISADPTGLAEAIVLECRTEHGLGCVPFHLNILNIIPSFVVPMHNLNSRYTIVDTIMIQLVQRMSQRFLMGDGLLEQCLLVHI